MASTKKAKQGEEKEKEKQKKKSSDVGTKKSSSKSAKMEKESIKKHSNVKVSKPEVVKINGSHEQSRSTPKKSSHKNQASNGNGTTPTKSEKKRKREENQNEFENGDAESKLCRFPVNRIRRIINDQSNVLKIRQEALFLVNKAAEKFIEQFCGEAYEYSVNDGKKSLGYKQLSSVVSEERRYDFLSDFVPGKIRAEDALSAMKMSDIGQGEELGDEAK